MYYIITGIVCFAAGVAVCWIYKQRTINTLADALSRGTDETKRVVDQIRKAGM